MTVPTGDTEAPRRVRRRRARVVLMVLVAFAAAGWGVLAWRFDLAGSLARAPAAIRQAGAWGVAGSIGLMVMHSFVPFPSELLATANGLVFGPWLGGLVSWTGSMLGAGLTFFLSRRYGHPVLAGWLQAQRLAALAHWTRRHGTMAVLVARLVPLVSFNLLNIAAGVAGLGWWPFLWTTAVGILPMTVLTALLGARLVSLPAWSWGLASLALLGVVVLAHRLHGGATNAHEPAAREDT